MNYTCTCNMMLHVNEVLGGYNSFTTYMSV